MPNFLYSIALAHFFSAQIEQEKIKQTDDINTNTHLIMAEQWLEKALSRFPFFLGQILNKLQIKPDLQVENCYALSVLAYHK